MDIVLLALRLMLATVFVTAAAGKFLDLPGSVRAVRTFGVPERLAFPVGVALPVSELVVGVFLIPRATAIAAATAGAILLVLFLAGIVWNLRQGKTPDCHCFGQFHSEPVGRRTLLRNAALAALALIVVVVGWDDPGASAVAWLGDVSATERAMLAGTAVALVVLLVEGLLLAKLVGRSGELMLRLDDMENRFGRSAQRAESSSPAPESHGGNHQAPGLPVGTPAPAFSLSRVDGATITLDELRADGTPMLLVFTAPDCASCEVLKPEIMAWRQYFAQSVTIVEISHGATASADPAHDLLLVQRELEVSDAYGVRGTPSAILVGSDGRIAAPVAEGLVHVRELAQLLASGEHRVVLQIGDVAPDFTLESLAGGEVSLSDLRGQERILIFWDPGCGYCQRMLPELKHLENDVPGLVIVSKGTTGAIAAQGLRSTILLDPELRTVRAFGATGTPSAILISAEGRIASNMMSGIAAVLTLVRDARSASLVAVAEH